MSLFVLLIAAGACSSQLATGAAPQAKPPAADEPKSSFVRLLRDGNDRPIALQTAIASYGRNEAGAGKGKGRLSVDLIGAVHIADGAYYAALNKRFAQYDALLYELVAPPGTRVPKAGAKSTHPIARLQQGLTGILDLDFQLDKIDYHKPNFVHADMSPEQFRKSMDDRNESFLTMFFRMMGYSLNRQNQPRQPSFEVSLLGMLLEPDPSLPLKRLMSEQLEDMEGSIGAIEGPQGSTIISERNKVALRVLATEIGRGKKRLGIFYGAGHLPDMEQRLAKELGLTRQTTIWLTAWDMTGRRPERAK